MGNIWSKFDKSIDVEGLKKDAIDAAGNGGEFETIPHGEYEVKIKELKPNESKKGDPMITIYFEIVEGKYKGSLIFYNQVLSSGFGLHKAKEMLKSLKTGLDVDLVTFAKFEDLLTDMMEVIEGNGLEYLLKYSENPKNNKFSEYEIIEVFED